VGLIKLLVFIAVVFAALTLWRRLQRNRGSRRSTGSMTTPKPMVRCSQCQVHLPEDLALRDNQRWYCCAEHRDADHHD
jgi:uncharacterized protein